MNFGTVIPCPVALASDVADNCEIEGPALISGGNADDPNPDYGPFILNGEPASNADPFIGARNLVKDFITRYGFSTPLGENFPVRTRLSRKSETP